MEDTSAQPLGGRAAGNENAGWWAVPSPRVGAGIARRILQSLTDFFQRDLLSLQFGCKIFPRHGAPRMIAVCRRTRTRLQPEHSGISGSYMVPGFEGPGIEEPRAKSANRISERVQRRVSVCGTETGQFC